jgi:hypothetical protein
LNNSIKEIRGVEDFMERYCRLSWLLSLVVAMLIGSCSLQVEPSAQETPNDSAKLTMREFQAIIKGRGNNTASIEELSRMVAYALEANVIPDGKSGSRNLSKKTRAL